MEISKKIKEAIVISILTLGTSVFASTRPVVYDIGAKAVDEDKILISWKIPQWNTGSSPSGIYIFRDTKPLENLFGKIPLAILPANSESFTDRPGDFREYYYAAIVATNPDARTSHLFEGTFYYDEQLDALPMDERDLILSGINSTTRGCRINGIVHSAENLETMEKNRLTRDAENKDYSGGLLREKPLPLIDFPKDIDESKSTISEETKNKAKILTQSSIKSHKKVQDLYIFPEDLSGNKKVPTGSLIKKDFSKAEKELNALLLDRKTTSEQKNRIRFYLAQCKYFTGDLENAAKDFSLLQDIFPRLSMDWAKASLDMMVEKK